MFKQYIGGELVEGKGTMLRVMNPANGTDFESGHRQKKRWRRLKKHFRHGPGRRWMSVWNG